MPDYRITPIDVPQSRASTPSRSTTASNRLLAALSRTERRNFLSDCEQVDLAAGEELYQPGKRIRHVYFPNQSFISLVNSVDKGVGLGIGLVGNEGMAGISLMFDTDVAPHYALVQGPGPAWRMNASQFLREIDQRPALRRTLKRYAYVLMHQFAQAAACTRFHVVEARLARWLLMSQDRAHSDQFSITHEFLAYLLGVRRVGVTKAATTLRMRRLISYNRGRIKILDRHGLEGTACECYWSGKQTYTQMVGFRGMSE